MEKLKLLSFEGENIGKLSAVFLQFKDGLNVIGGKNGVGKTTVARFILSLLGGEAYTPENAVKEGEDKAAARLTLNNGVEVWASYTAKGRGRLHISGIDSTGGVQTVIKKLFGDKALDLSRMLLDKDRGTALARIIGVDLDSYDTEYEHIFNERRDINRQLKKARGYYDSLPQHEITDTATLSMEQLIEEQQKIIKTKQSNDAVRLQAVEKQRKLNVQYQDISALDIEIQKMQSDMQAAMEKRKLWASQYEFLTEQVSALDAMCNSLKDDSDEDVIERMKSLEESNNKIRQNHEKIKAGDDIESLTVNSEQLTESLADNRKALADYLKSADMPLPGMGFVNGEITLNGISWDSMSTSDQYIVCMEILARQNPDAPVLIVDRLETFDMDALEVLGQRCLEKGIQIIGIRVSTGKECDWIIEEGG